MVSGIIWEFTTRKIISVLTLLILENGLGVSGIECSEEFFQLVLTLLILENGLGEKKSFVQELWYFVLTLLILENGLGAATD